MSGVRARGVLTVLDTAAREAGVVEISARGRTETSALWRLSTNPR